MKKTIRLSVLFAVVSGLFLAGCAKEQAEPLAAPQLTHTEGATWYEVEWNAISHALGYSVSLDEGTTWSATQTATEFRKEGLTPETLYKVWVKSVGDGNKHIDSKASRLEITTLQADDDEEELIKLATPALDCQADVNNARISWAAVENAMGYRVSIDDCATWGNHQAELYYDYGDLSPETAYKVYVKAVGDGETYADSDPAEIEFTTTAVELIKLETPALDCQADVNNARISWATVENASGYRVSVDECATWSDKQTELHYDYGDLSPETAYKVYVKAVGDGETYADSDPAEIEFTTNAVELAKLETPTLDYQTNVRNARITWMSVENATGYQVSVDECVTWKNKQTGLYYDYGGLSPETAYKVYVKAVGDGETYADSDAAEVEFTTRPDELIAGEYSYKPVEWPEDIVAGQKFLIGYVTSDHVRIMDKTSTQKPAGVDLSGQYDVANDLFPSNSITDEYAYTIKDAGDGYYYLENPEGKTLGWSSGTNFNYSSTGDNARWSITEGNDGENLSFHIKNVKSISEVASHRGIVYTYRSEGEQSFDLFAPYAMNNIDHDEYREPCLYMLDKPLEGGEPVDPEPEPGEDLMYVRVTDPDKIYSGDRCILVGYCSAGVVRAMDYAEQTRPSGVDFSEYYVSADNAFVSNEQSDAYSFTVTKAGSDVWLTNPNGKYVAYGSGTELSYVTNNSSPNSKWTMSTGAKANTIRLQNQGETSRVLSYRYASQNTFGAYATSNLSAGSTEYYDVMLYVLKSIESSGEEPGDGEETGFPAQWDMSKASITAGKCYAATGNTQAYLTVSGAKDLEIAGSSGSEYLVATGWNATGAAWVIEVPVTNLTETETTVEITTRSSNTGPKDFVVSYSTDGTNYTSTNKTYTCASSDGNTSIEFIPTVTGFPSSLFIKLEVKSGSKAVNGSAIAAGGTSRLSKIKLMKWYK